jgi:hypothetical protein
VSKLRKLTKTCNYGELAESLKCDRIICGIIDNTARKRLLQEDKLIFNKVHRHLQSFRVDMCKIENEESAEATDDIKAVRHNLLSIKINKANFRCTQNKETACTVESNAHATENVLHMAKLESFCITV